jgi:hypothetical protein
MNIIYMRYLLDDTNTRPAKPHLRPKVKKLSEIITYSTSLNRGASSSSAPNCRKIFKGKPCTGILKIKLRPEPDLIHWKCPVCGDEAFLTGWEGLHWDKTAKTRYTHKSEGKCDDAHKGSDC